jgi:hypothetical protein
MNGASVPSREVVDKLAAYANLLTAFGPDSQQATAFFAAHRELPLFERNARELYALEKEDYDARSRFLKRTS